jgi:cation/acetate symporter
LLLSIYWSKLTTRGAFVGGTVGLVSAIVLVIMGPAVWKDALGNKEAFISLKNPAIISMTLTFVVTWIVSKMDTSARGAEDKAGFEAQYIRAQTGIGIDGASGH